MSHQAVAWAMEVRVGDPTLKSLLIAICHRADRLTWACWPSLDCLAWDTEVSKRTIQRRLEELVEKGFISIESRRRDDGTRDTSLITVTGGQIVTLQPPVDKNGLTSGQKPGSPVDNTCPPIKKQEEQEEQSIGGADDFFTAEPPAKKNKRRSTMPAEYPMTDRHKKYAVERGLANGYAETIFENFKNHHAAKGTVMLDWDAAWRTWVGNEIKFSAGRVPQNPKQAPPRPGMVYGDDYM